MHINDPISKLRGVGPSLATQLTRIGIKQAIDLLFHLPYRYIDRTHLTPIADLLTEQEALVEGELLQVPKVHYGRRRALSCRLGDSSGVIALRFFHFSEAQRRLLTSGARLRCYGQIREGKGMLEMVHPEYQRLDSDALTPLDERLTPIYPTTKGLHQKRLQKLIAQALDLLTEDAAIDYLPPALCQVLSLPGLIQALQYVHYPPPDADIMLLQSGRHPAQQRLAFEELLAQSLSLHKIRQQIRARSAPILTVDKQTQQRFLAMLPFQLTGAQQAASETICLDLGKGTAMLRLLQGDVGSGKTVVAALAALQALASGYQVAFMAPTELLAEQHFRTFRAWFDDFSIPIVLLSSRLLQAERRACQESLQASAPVLAIGTHALFQEEVQFASLGLVIIDEQHRFGVHQRLALLEKGQQADYCPHQLVMTATPIPRTLAMTAYADLDNTIINELPPHRQPVHTSIISDASRGEIIERIQRIFRSGRQIYWVCTLIDEAEDKARQTAIATYEKLQQQLPDLTVGLVHGRMKSDEKNRCMEAFKMGDIQLLVATTVIEVGVDVPNASLMVIENADRLGLAQLHQLRGRVGRGKEQSYCLLMYHPPLGALAKQRLEVLRNTQDGFIVAEADLKLRGGGELLGTSQTGLPAMRIADLVRDAELLPAVQKATASLQRQPDIAEQLINRWIGEKLSFGHV